MSFDSTLNTPVVGDERYFLSGKVEGEVGGVQDLIEVKPGDIVQLRLFFANDGEPNSPHPLPLLARDLRARLELPRDPASLVRIVGWLTAQNAYPASVFDSLELKSSETFTVHLIKGSGEVRNKAHPDGIPLPDSLVGSGAMLGYQKLDGRLNTCFCHAGYVLAKVVIGATPD